MPRNAHKFAEDKRAFIRSFLGNNKLHGSGVHAIAKRRDDSQIRRRKKCVKLVFLDGLMTNTYRVMKSSNRYGDILMMNRDEIKRAEFTVDVRDKL